jgi:hypothetical protein
VDRSEKTVVVVKKMRQSAFLKFDDIYVSQHGPENLPLVR